MYLDWACFGQERDHEAVWILQDADGSRGTVSVALNLKV